jgi:hypothetical protein
MLLVRYQKYTGKVMFMPLLLNVGSAILKKTKISTFCHGSNHKIPVTVIGALTGR